MSTGDVRGYAASNACADPAAFGCAFRPAEGIRWQHSDKREVSVTLVTTFDCRQISYNLRSSRILLFQVSVYLYVQASPVTQLRLLTRGKQVCTT